jgi:hypothetical protein
VPLMLPKTSSDYWGKCDNIFCYRHTRQEKTPTVDSSIYTDSRKENLPLSFSSKKHSLLKC